MSPDEVNTYVVQKLWDLYPKTFEPPPVAQFLLWCRALAPYERATAKEVLERWVGWHRTDPPELAEIVRDCKAVVYEAARWQAPADALPLERSAVQGLVLKYMSQINQRLLGPVQANGQVLPRLGLEDVPKLLRTLSAAHRDDPTVAHEFNVLSVMYAELKE